MKPLRSKLEIISLWIAFGMPSNTCLQSFDDIQNPQSGMLCEKYSQTTHTAATKHIDYMATHMPHCVKFPLLY